MSKEYNDFILDMVRRTSPRVAEILKKEMARQDETVELIASENWPSDAALAVNGSVFNCKYTEGYPAQKEIGNKGRYYGGCQYYDELETYGLEVFRKAFNTNYYFNLQPHSGSNANMIAYAAVLKPKDTILAMSLDNGGHLTHGSAVNFSGKLYDVKFYNVDSNGFIDYEDLEKKMRLYRPKLILAGASAYSRTIDFQRIRKIIEAVRLDYFTGYDIDYRPYFMVDMAHIAGLVAAGEHPTPFGFADIITFTTHKTFRSCRGAVVACKPELAKKIDSACFPYGQGGSIQSAIAAKIISAEETMTDEYKDYIRQVKANAKAMCGEFIKMGYEVVTGGTDNHMFLIDLSRTHPNLTGKQVQNELDEHKITLNKNCVPNEKRSPTQASGIRIGTAPMTTKGWKEQDFIDCAHKIDEIISSIANM